MRATVLIGLALVAVGFAALYQVKNGFLMSSLSLAYYSPPEDPAELQPAFDELGGIEAADGGFYLRADCTGVDRLHPSPDDGIAGRRRD